MESIVNYSSEDEQDEPLKKTAAERGAALSRSSGGRAKTSSSVAPYVSSTGASSSGGRSSYRDEDSHKTRRTPTRQSPPGTGRSSKRSNTSKHYREHRYRDTKEKNHKDSRGGEHRENGNGFRHDHKMNERNRSRDYKKEQRDSKRRNDDERDYNNSGSSSGNRPMASSGSVSWHHKERHNDAKSSRYISEQAHRNFRSHDGDRSDRHDRHPRRGRSSDRQRRRVEESRSKSRSRTRSPASPAANQKQQQQQQQQYHHHSKRSDKQRNRLTRSRSHSANRRSNSGERIAAVTDPLEKARRSAVEMERTLNMTEAEEQQQQPKPRPQPLIPSTMPAIRPLMSLPLSDTAPKLPNLIAVAGANFAQSLSNNGEPAVIQLPSYYNPSVINPTKYAQQVQKRKLIWGAKKVEDTAAKWGHAQFSQDSDGKVASKFMRLMGMKGAAVPKAEPPEEEAAASTTKPDVQSREAMFSSMEQQYEVARQATHTMRGVGLGFSSQARPF